jgi:hypothetical protein
MQFRHKPLPLGQREHDDIVMVNASQILRFNPAFMCVATATLSTSHESAV